MMKTILILILTHRHCFDGDIKQGWKEWKKGKEKKKNMKEKSKSKLK